MEDLTYDNDIRGDYALFIDAKHFLDEWELDDETKKLVGSKLTFFRVIQDGEQGNHGWIENGEIIQWG
jgi:hypothetical protein